MTFACFYKLGKTMRLNVMASCGYLASAAELALRSRSLAKLKDTRVAFLTFFVVRDAIRRGRTHAVVECENNTFETSNVFRSQRVLLASKMIGVSHCRHKSAKSALFFIIGVYK